MKVKSPAEALNEIGFNFPDSHEKENKLIDQALLLDAKANPKEPMNNYTETTDEFNTHYFRYNLIMDKRGFDEFSLIQQQILCEKKNIILIHKRNLKERLEQKFIELAKPYKSPKVIMINLSKKLTIQNLNKGITKFNKGMDQFNKMIEAPKSQKELSLPNYKEMRDLLGSEKDNSQKAITDLLGNKKNGYRFKF